MLLHTERHLFRIGIIFTVAGRDLYRIIALCQIIIIVAVRAFLPHQLFPGTVPEYHQIALCICALRPVDLGAVLGCAGVNRHDRRFRHDLVRQVGIHRAAIADDLHRVQLPLTALDLIGNISLDGVQGTVCCPGHQPHMAQRIRIPVFAVERYISGTWRIAAALRSAFLIALLSGESGVGTRHRNRFRENIRADLRLFRTPGQKRLTPGIGITSVDCAVPMVILCPVCRSGIAQLGFRRRQDILRRAACMHKGIFRRRNGQPRPQQHHGRQQNRQPPAKFLFHTNSFLCDAYGKGAPFLMRLSPIRKRLNARR